MNSPQFGLGFKDGSMLAEEAESTKDWLAGTSPYQAFVESFYHSDPRLRSRDPKAVTEKIVWDDSHGRVAILEMGVDGTFGYATECANVDSLRAQLAKINSTRKMPASSRRRKAAAADSGSAGSTGSSPIPKRRSHRTLYIMEGMGPGFIGLLGEHLGLHPSAFLDHERVIVMNTAAQGESDGMLLPSLSCPTAITNRHTEQRHVTMKYFETMQFDRCPDNFRLVCGDSGRHIGVSRVDGEFVDVGVVRRKCTTWSRRTSDDDWDCLIICDPPVTSVRTGFEYRDLFPVKTQPYQGGYVDFVPEWAQVRRHEGAIRRSGPPRTCLLDDLVYYLQEHGGNLVVNGAYATSPLAAMADPDIVIGTFVRKIVASHYIKLASHVRAVLSGAQRALSRKHDLSSLPMEKVEELWSDTQASERRVGEYGEDLEAIMLKLGIPLDKPSPGRAAASNPVAFSLVNHYSPSALSLAAPAANLAPLSPPLKPVSTPVHKPLTWAATTPDPIYPPETHPIHSRTDTNKTLIGNGGGDGLLSKSTSAATLAGEIMPLAEKLKSMRSSHIAEEAGENASDIEVRGGGYDQFHQDVDSIDIDIDVDDDDEDESEEDKRERMDELRTWLDVSVDYQFLLLRFRELRHRTECLNSAVTGLASITGNRQAYHEQQLALETAKRSIREAKSSKAVTLLGLIFIPLAYTSSVFSMTEPYGPGGSEFWQYFVASVPLIAIVLVAFYILDAGYTDDGTSWSLKVFLATAKHRFSRPHSVRVKSVANGQNCPTR